jgi:hypothetical protein
LFIISKPDEELKEWHEKRVGETKRQDLRLSFQLLFFGMLQANDHTRRSLGSDWLRLQVHLKIGAIRSFSKQAVAQDFSNMSGS